MGKFIVIDEYSHEMGTSLEKATKGEFNTWDEACDFIKDEFYGDDFCPESPDDLRVRNFELTNLYGMGCMRGYVVQQV